MSDRERPILFSTPMVRALLAGTKTQTRRIVKPAPHRDATAVERHYPSGGYLAWRLGTGTPSSGVQVGAPLYCPYGVVGDRLWVRETHCRFLVGEGMDQPVPECVAYRATHGETFDYINTRGEETSLSVTKWTPAIFMPRWASRINLEITGIRVQRLHAISEDDAKAEGVERDTAPCDHTRRSCADVGCMGPTYRSTYAELWNEINGEDGWDANPWVWVISFARVARVARVDEVCDGLHDEGAPDHHLCSRCYPNGSEALREDVSGEA